MCVAYIFAQNSIQKLEKRGFATHLFSCYHLIYHIIGLHTTQVFNILQAISGKIWETLGNKMFNLSGKPCELCRNDLLRFHNDNVPEIFPETRNGKK